MSSNLIVCLLFSMALTAAFPTADRWVETSGAVAPIVGHPTADAACQATVKVVNVQHISLCTSGHAPYRTVGCHKIDAPDSSSIPCGAYTVWYISGGWRPAFVTVTLTAGDLYSCSSTCKTCWPTCTITPAAMVGTSPTPPSPADSCRTNFQWPAGTPERPDIHHIVYEGHEFPNPCDDPRCEPCGTATGEIPTGIVCACGTSIPKAGPSSNSGAPTMISLSSPPPLPAACQATVQDVNVQHIGLCTSDTWSVGCHKIGAPDSPSIPCGAYTVWYDSGGMNEFATVTLTAGDLYSCSAPCKTCLPTCTITPAAMVGTSSMQPSTRLIEAVSSAHSGTPSSLGPRMVQRGASYFTTVTGDIACTGAACGCYCIAYGNDYCYSQAEIDNAIISLGGCDAAMKRIGNDCTKAPSAAAPFGVNLGICSKV